MIVVIDSLLKLHVVAVSRPIMFYLVGVLGIYGFGYGVYLFIVCFRPSKFTGKSILPSVL